MHMQTTIDRQTLREAVDKAGLFVPTRSTLPQLESIQFSANGKLELRATDLETSVLVTLPRDGEGLGDGVMNLPAELFQKALAGKDSGLVRLEYEKAFRRAKMFGSLQTKQGQSFKLEASFSVDEVSTFPAPVQFPATAPGFFIEAEKLRAIARKCAPFASTDTLHPATQCVLFAYNTGILRAVASDGRRLVELRLPIVAGEPFELLVPAPALDKAARAMREVVQVQFTETHVRIACDGVEVIALRCDEKFPDYGKVIPRDIATVVTVDRNSLEQALRPLAVCANNQTNRLTFTLNECAELVIEAGDVWNAVGIERIRANIAHPGEGHPFPFCIDARMLRAALDILESNEPSFRFTAPLLPVVFEETTDIFRSVLVLVCPQRPEQPDQTGGLRHTALGRQVEPDETPAVATASLSDRFEARAESPAECSARMLVSGESLQNAMNGKRATSDLLAEELAMARTDPAIIAELVEADDLAQEAIIEAEKYDSTLEQARAFVGVERAFAAVVNRQQGGAL
jgi:DNA polymerase-3 subunit beta